MISIAIPIIDHCFSLISVAIVIDSDRLLSLVIYMQSNSYISSLRKSTTSMYSIVLRMYLHLETGDALKRVEVAVAEAPHVRGEDSHARSQHFLMTNGF